MATKKAKTFNSQVYDKACSRLNITPTERNIFQRLLGFLIRNDNPFPYSAVAMKKNTGYSLRTIFRTFDRLEYLRLIERIGMGKNRRFKRGSILIKILITVPYSIINKLTKISTTVPLCHENLTNRAMVAYKKTSSSLKRKEGISFYDPNYQEYAGDIKSRINLGLLLSETKIMNYEEWRASIDHANIKK